MISKAPEVNSFANALGNGRFGIIAELKKKSPSAGDMREDNFKQAPSVYAKSPIVKAVSVLTNFSHFGMTIDEISRVRPLVRKPILRKDFIIKEYQVLEARAFGADAILLMANVLSKTSLQNLFEVASELNLDVLFEVHDESEISKIPDGAKIYGVNSRKFMGTHRWRFARLLLRLGLGRYNKAPDLSVEMAAFNLIHKLPKTAIKVAESGVRPNRLSQVANMGYDSVLIGTSILKSPDGVDHVISEFERAIVFPADTIPAASPVPA
jgi:indole-3-glycerol phosphate synthase